MRRSLAGAAVVLALALPAAAHAKSCVRLAVAPAGPSAGMQARLVATTFLPTWERGRLVRLEPMVLPASFRMRLVVAGPEGRLDAVALHRDARRPSRWSARYAFAVPGRWRLRIEGWDYAPAACARALAVRVRAGR